MEKKKFEKPEFKIVGAMASKVFASSEGCNSDGGCDTEVCPQYQCAECLAAGTKITLADGATKQIEEIAEGDMIRTFDHKTGMISESRVCLVYKGENKDKALNLTFESGKTLAVVGTHDILLEDTRKYVRINVRNVEQYLGKRFYNAELQAWDTLSAYTYGEDVDFYCIYSENHLNCIAEGMLTVPDDVDYILNSYELDETLKADAELLNADIAKYGLVDVARDYPQYIQYKELMEALQCKYQNIAIGKGLMTETDLTYAREYWNQNTAAA